jgi:anthrone oxygenase-like protein
MLRALRRRAALHQRSRAPCTPVLRTEIAAAEWAPSYKRATSMQARLALAGCISAIAVWLTAAAFMWSIGGLLLGLVVPFTLVVIMPTNQQLLSPDLERRSEQARRLLEKWNGPHGVRTVLTAFRYLGRLDADSSWAVEIGF